MEKTSKDKVRPLTPKQQRFCEQYLVDFNGTQAAIRAGYSSKGAFVRGSELLSNRKVSDYLADLIKEQSKRTGITADVVLKELHRIATTDVSDAFDDNGNLRPIKDIPLETRRAIASVEIFEEYEGRGKERESIGQTKKVRFWDKVKALEHLCRHLGIFEKNNAQMGQSLSEITMLAAKIRRKG
jgi:phage terminase small subunit